jgi:hypothetical protein
LSPTSGYAPRTLFGIQRGVDICFVGSRLSSLIQLSGFFLCFCGAWQVVDRTFQVGASGRGRCDRPAKSSGPPLLKLSLKVKRNSTHSQSSALVVAPVLRLQRSWSLKGPPRAQPGALLDWRIGHRGSTLEQTPSRRCSILLSFEKLAN